MKRLLLIFSAAAWMLAAQQAAPPFVPNLEQIGEIKVRMAVLGAKLEELESKHAGTDVFADVVIFHKAAEWILRHPEEFFTKAYLDNTLKALETGAVRASELQEGKTKWPNRKGRAVRAYLSRVDGSVQPYGVIVPENYDARTPIRLDVILHGRGARLNEVSFIADNEWAKAAPAQSDRLELHIFGRTNNAYRWAGETDVFEALAAMRRNYSIDPQRIVLRGFSMGGAGTWHIGLQHPARWAAIEAGAGFSETKSYAKQANAPEHQQRAWAIYDAFLYARNALMVPTVGYGSIDDPQLQASVNIKEQLLRERIQPESIPALFLVGPKIGHKYAPESKKVSEDFIAKALASPRNPDRVQFLTHTTRYWDAGWVRVDGLEKHYARAEVDGTRSGNTAEIKTKGVTHLVLRGIDSARVDGQNVTGSPSLIEKRDGKWATAKATPGVLRKRHGLQGPIDDAFMGSFLCVRPTGTFRDSAVNLHALTRLNSFRSNWDKYLRGDVRLKDDNDVTDKDIASHHLVLFGEPSSNKVMARVLPKLPFRWENGKVEIAGKTFQAASLLLVAIYPNPLNPEKYVVLNSGHTFGEADFKGTNALLFPRLGDWAVLDSQGKTLAAGFFDERWK
ncbi:MAG: prolyl oligopeptidase family serine peptidase [Candidatus Solibacter usitatus]|nr:prolyl oligopeptidase family serine peptidase [Candidatus Solibacter usitatus]